MTTLADDAQETTAQVLAPRTSSASRWRRRAPLLPALVFTVIVTQLPFVATLVISSVSWNILRPGREKFVWLQNYQTVFTDDRLRTDVVNTIVLTASVVIVSLLLGLGSRCCWTAASRAAGWPGPC